MLFLKIAKIIKVDNQQNFADFFTNLVDNQKFGYYNIIKGQRKSNLKILNMEGLWQVEVI